MTKKTRFKQSYKPGDVVIYNESIWRVESYENGVGILIEELQMKEPRKNWCQANQIRHATLLDLCSLRLRLDNMIRELVKKNSAPDG